MKHLTIDDYFALAATTQRLKKQLAEGKQCPICQTKWLPGSKRVMATLWTGYVFGAIMGLGTFMLLFAMAGIKP